MHVQLPDRRFGNLCLARTVGVFHSRMAFIHANCILRITSPCAICSHYSISIFVFLEIFLLATVQENFLHSVCELPVFFQTLSGHCLITV